MQIKIRQAFPACRILFTNLRLYIQPHYVIVHNISAAYIRTHAFGDIKAPLFIDGNGRLVMLIYGEVNIFTACFLRFLFYPAEHSASQPQAAESFIHIQFAQKQRFALKRHGVITRAHRYRARTQTRNFHLFHALRLRERGICPSYNIPALLPLWKKNAPNLCASQAPLSPCIVQEFLCFRKLSSFKKRRCRGAPPLLDPYSRVILQATFCHWQSRRRTLHRIWQASRTR